MNPDFSELLSTFNDHGVEYLVVGAHALAAHGHVRATKDLEMWVRPEPANATPVLRALAAFGAPLHELSERDLSEPGLIFQIGVPPVRIDVNTAIDGVQFADAWSGRVQATLGAVTVPVISREDLIRNKKAAGRACRIWRTSNGSRRLQGRARGNADQRLGRQGAEELPGGKAQSVLGSQSPIRS